jgi:hypothetical protein
MRATMNPRAILCLAQPFNTLGEVGELSLSTAQPLKDVRVGSMDASVLGSTRELHTARRTRALRL